MRIGKFLKESTVVQFMAAATRIETSVNEILSAQSLTLMQSLILVSIFFEDEKQARPKDLSMVFKTTKGNVSHCISHLEELRLLKRIAKLNDRRGCYVRLTKKGSDLSTRLVGYFDGIENRAEASLLPLENLDFTKILLKMSRSIRDQKFTQAPEHDIEYFV